MDWIYGSAIPEIKWPAIPDVSTALTLSLNYFLQDSQWWSGDELLHYQSKQLCVLLEFARKQSPFYIKRLDGISISEQDLLSGWNDIPILTRRDLQSQSLFIDSKCVPAGHSPVTSVRTSGSTGLAVSVSKTALCQLFWKSITFRDHIWHKRDFSGKLASIRYIFDKNKQHAEGVTSWNWGGATSGIVRTGPVAGLHILTPVEEQARWLAKHNPQYLLTHPSVMLELTRLFIKQGHGLPNLLQVRTISETLPDELRNLVRQAWGVPLVDVYSSMEVGYIALQCPEHDHYHVQAEHIFLEILDDNGNPCKPGEVGRVVVTCLHNFATPLIRYEIGDLAEVGEPCSCGRGLPVIKKIWGRYRNLVTLPNGEKKWPVCSLLYFDSPEPFLQAQLVQKNIEEIEVIIAALQPFKESTEFMVRDYLTERLGYAFHFDFKYVDEIKRQANGKFEEFISLL